MIRTANLLFVYVFEIADTGYPNIKPYMFFMSCVDLEASRCGQQLHAHIRGSEQQCTQSIDYHVQACIDLFRPGAIALIDRIDIIFLAPFDFEVNGTDQIDRKDDHRSH